MKRTIFGWVSAILTIAALPAAAQTLEKVTRIWDNAPHSAFTGLIDYHGKLYCCFRESNRHVPQVTGVDDGRIRVLGSVDGTQWDSVALVSLEGIDLRDPELVETSDGRMMLVMGGSRYEDGKFLGGITHVSFWDPASERFSVPAPIEIDRELFPGTAWLWRVRWHKGNGYGVVYDKNNVSLVKTGDGIHYELVSRLDVDSLPNETDLLFGPDDELLLLVRRELSGAHGLLGSSHPPYTDWQWQDIGRFLGGPRLIRLPDGTLRAGTRAAFEPGKPVCALFSVSPEGRLIDPIVLPSGGDCSYTGMVVRGDKLYVSYYSQHELGKCCIYFATFKLP